MQVTAQTAAFLFLRSDEPLARVLQVRVELAEFIGQFDGMRGTTCLLSNDVEQVHIGCGERFALGTWREG